MDDGLRAISDPTRREILRLVRERELTAGEIAARFTVTRPAVSQHLKVLRDAGLIDERRAGTRRFYRASPDGLRDLRASLDWLWDEHLSRLREVAEAAERGFEQQGGDADGGRTREGGMADLP